MQMLSVTPIFLYDASRSFHSIRSCVLLTSEAELHLSVRPAWKVGDPVQSHTDGHGDRSQDVHECLQLSALHSARLTSWRLPKGVRGLRPLLRWKWMRAGRETRHGATTRSRSSQAGRVMFEEANKVTQLVSVSRAQGKTHRDGRRLPSMNTIPHHIRKWGWHLAQGHLGSALETSQHLSRYPPTF